MARKRLGDLFAEGKEIDIQGIKVWIQKPNVVQMEDIIRKANAAKARISMKLKNPESDNSLEVTTAVTEDFPTREVMIDFLVASEISDSEVKIGERLSEDEEGKWGENNYLNGLLDLWELEGLKEVYTETSEEDRKDNDEYDKAVEVFEEIKAFNEEVAKEVEGERKALARDFEQMRDEKILDKVVEKRKTYQENVVWFSTYRKAQMFYATREPDDRSKLYFSGMGELDELHPVVMKTILDTLAETEVGRQEGKD